MALAGAGTAFAASGLAPALQSIAVAIFAVSVVLVGGGSAAQLLSRPRALDAQHTHAPGAVRRGVLAVTLVALPVWLAWQLWPFLAEMQRVADVLSWRQASEGIAGAGFLLLPIAAVTATPALQLLAFAACVATSVVMLARLVSPRLWQIWTVCVALAAAFAVASALGARASAGAAAAARDAITTSSPTAQERTLLLDAVDRYDRAVTGAAMPLLWALGGYVIGGALLARPSAP